jgi:hypothetical protein
MLAAGWVLADGNDALSSRTFTTAEAGFNLNHGNLQLAERAIDDRIIDRLGLFDSSNSDQPTRYSVSLDVEKEDTDWSFEVTVTMEF